MADRLPPKAQRISGISCVGLALDSNSYLTRHSFQQLGERNPTVEDLSHPAWQWDEQAVQNTNKRIEGLPINALLVELAQPELLTTGPAAKVPSGKDFRLDRTTSAPAEGPLPAAASAPRADPTGVGASACSDSSRGTWQSWQKKVRAEYFLLFPNPRREVARRYSGVPVEPIGEGACCRVQLRSRSAPTLRR
jgi:hypothetical protein